MHPLIAALASREQERAFGFAHMRRRPRQAGCAPRGPPMARHQRRPAAAASSLSRAARQIRWSSSRARRGRGPRSARAGLSARAVRARRASARAITCSRSRTPPVAAAFRASELDVEPRKTC
eukprot:scaffold116278_cov32-Tisochrysis_lutea.AAC.3